MNGAEALLKTATAAGIEVCFANAGTTEMPVIAAFDSLTGIRPILGLFEGVCTGAADGYGRMKEKPAMALLHLGPGLSNGIANLHNARRARTPLLNLIGEHASWHLAADPPLNMNVAALAKTVSGWTRTTRSVKRLSRDMAEAIAATYYGQIASLIVPADHQWLEYPGESITTPQVTYETLDQDMIEAAARLIKSSPKTAIIMNGRALRSRGLAAAARIKAAVGCDLFSVTFPAYMDRGAGRAAVTRIPYFPDEGEAVLSPYQTVLLAGTEEPVAFFGYKGGKSYLLTRSVQKMRIDGERQDAAEALEALADALDAPMNHTNATVLAGHHRPEAATGKLTAEKACITLAALQPDDAIIVDEGLTSSFAYYPLAATLAPHSFMNITGGAIGQGMPCSVGAAVACPERPVINIQADGSAMYTLQALWTQAREGLNVTSLICSNRSYYIVQLELLRAGYATLGPRALSLTDLVNPVLDWVKMSQGMGVPAVSVETAEDLARELKIALQEPGPHLIEMVL
jgi:acetolactate synthase I/II/III large subunit